MVLVVLVVVVWSWWVGWAVVKGRRGRRVRSGVRGRILWSQCEMELGSCRWEEDKMKVEMEV